VILKLRTSLPFQEARTSLTTFTDGFGKFSFAKLTSGPYMIIATNPGHVSPGFQDLEPEEMSAEITLKVFRSQSIAGTVKDDQGNPVEGVLVYVLNYKGLNARTDAEGRYTVSGLLPEDYSLLAIRKTYKSVKLPGVKSGSKGVDFVLHKK